MSDQEFQLADPEDRLMDVWLEEVIGEQSPPDLVNRILEKYSQSDPATVSQSLPIELSKSPISRRKKKKTKELRIFVLVATLFLAALGGIAFWTQSQNSDRSTVAEQEKTNDSTTDNKKVIPEKPSSEGGGRENTLPLDPLPVVDPIKPVDPIRPPVRVVDQPTKKTKPELPEVLANREIINGIESRLAQHWTSAKIAPSQQAEDAAWCRRLYLRLLGRIPTVDELKQFTKLPKTDRRELLVDQLLASEMYQDERSEYWANFLVNTFIGRRGGTGEKLGDRSHLLTYVRDSLQASKPYDDMVYEMMSATGSSDPKSDEFNGAVNFWLVHYAPDSVQVTAHAAQVFWGESLGCVRCHDEIGGTGRQEDYWQFNPLMRTVRAQKDPQTGATKLVALGTDESPEVYFERPDGRLAMAQPRMPDQSKPGEELLSNPGGLRKEVARQWADSPRVATALVNRLWQHFLGFNFAQPTAELDAATPNHNDVLQFLAGQLRAHDYQLESVIGWIVRSDAFGRSSQFGDSNQADSPESGSAPLFSRYYTRPLAPEAVYQSLALVASPAGKIDPASLVKGRRQWLGKMIEQMNTDEGGEHSLFEQGVQKSWMLMNDPLMQRATNSTERGFLHRVATSDLPAEQKIEHLFLAAVSRKPTKTEQKRAQELLKQRNDQPELALEDIWWALLNSNEFLSDH